MGAPGGGADPVDQLRDDPADAPWNQASGRASWTLMTPASRRPGTSRAWIVAWIAGAGIGVANGVLREVTYGKKLSEPAASRLSALAAVIAFGSFFRGLDRRWPLAGSRESLCVGGIWLALTVCFEFGFGRLVAKRSWQEL